MQLSPWHGPAETGLCPDGSSICRDANNICRGPDAGHSISFLRRMFIYHWFGGSALNTAECCTCYGFDDGAGKPWNQTSSWETHPAHWAQPNGEMLKDTFRLYASRDRGTPYVPLAIMMDAEAGYGGSICSPIDRQQWGTFKHNEHTQSVYDLLNEQLLSCEPECQYPAIGANLSRGETMQLRSSPYGEIADVLQSDAVAAALALYPVVLLVGDIDFEREPRLVQSLAAAAQSSGTKLKKVLMLPYHIDAMGHEAFAELQKAFTTSTAVEVLDQWLNPKLNRSAAISDARLSSLAAELNLVNVSASPFGVQWSTNTLETGDVLVYVANNGGVVKPACSAQVLDASRAIEVSVTPTSFSYASVEEWLGGVPVTGGEGGRAAVHVKLGPGDATILQFHIGQTEVAI